jgi:hypothetical protein
MKYLLEMKYLFFIIMLQVHYCLRFKFTTVQISYKFLSNPNFILIFVQVLDFILISV